MIVNLDPQVGQSDINIGSFLNKFVILVHGFRIKFYFFRISKVYVKKDYI